MVTLLAALEKYQVRRGIAALCIGGIASALRAARERAQSLAREVLAREAGLDPDEVAAGIQRDDIKERLKANTAEALARGVTGIPTVAIGDELFWGDDRLDDALTWFRHGSLKP